MFRSNPQFSQLLNDYFGEDLHQVRLRRQAGLSGNTWLLERTGQKIVVRYPASGMLMPGIDRQREFKILRHLRASPSAPIAYCYLSGYLLLEWLPGTTLSPVQFSQHLPVINDTLIALHRYPLSGFPLSLSVLLEQYWLLSIPSRRHLRWFRALRRCLRLGEPHPLRVALLHMDIHPGNILLDGGTIRLIDWEYAGDGDVALELAAIIVANGLSTTMQDTLIAHYAIAQHLSPQKLQQQIARWRPWVMLLSASWYELRWQQSGDEVLRQRADEAWQHLTMI